MRHLPNFITSLNLFTGAIGCFLIATGELSTPIVIVMIAAFFDLLDGLVARLLGISSPMGKELDSLADMVSFGMLPSFYMSLRLSEHSSGYIYLAGFLIAIFSALRLAKFNIDDRQSDKFIGLPTPANAIMICSLSFVPANYLNEYSLLAITVVSSLLLVAPIELIAFKFKNFQWKDNSMRFLLIFLIIFLLVVFQWKALPLVIPCYLVISIIGNFLVKNGS
ncbi:MAG: CDP-diacylglycerol--serine O-phosphatidyltransferase [Bacteroidota bacterium]